jgi:starch phosphorylase
MDHGGAAGFDERSFAESIRRHLRYSVGKLERVATPTDLYVAVSLATREILLDRLFETEARYRAADAKRLYYLSVEYLVGRSLGNNLLNLGILDRVERILAPLGVALEDVREAEPDPALGNGGLGRLAACFLDSLASLDLPGFGYGIHYEHGIFRQAIENGYQREHPDSWRSLGAPWLVPRPDRSCLVPVYGRLGRRAGRGGGDAPAWTHWRVIVGVQRDMPIVGHGGRTVNWLRLFSARSSDEFDMEIFKTGDYLRAFARKLETENISKVLYPPDSSDAGKELRLLQEYFFVACALRDILAQFTETRRDLEAFPDKVAIQLNDTHPALAIAELVRLLVDEQHLPFEKAFHLARRSIGYTNHTLLPEALERWPRPLLARVVPRHLQIIEEINARFLQEVELRWPGDVDRLRRMSVIEEGHPQHVRMAHLAIVGSHAVNGVSRLHSDLLKKTLVPDFAELWPERFQNKTNGISPRRWLLKTNAGLARLAASRIGDAFTRDLEALRALEPFAADAGFRAEFRAVKRANKERLARFVELGAGVRLDPAAMFDVQVKRIHEYKRQLLAVLHAVHLYLSIVEDGKPPAAPRACLFAGKAAPEYFMAKLVIKLISNLAQVVNQDPRATDHLRVVFVPDYRVSVAETIIPAADLSEQISTAGMEASGTGNMKLALNGALTIGTFDGANIEIHEAVGAENIYIFGLGAEEIAVMRREGSYRPRERYEASAVLRRVIDAIAGNRFSPEEPGIFQPIRDNLLDHGDPYFCLADFDAYLTTQERVARDFAAPEEWSRRAILNVARVGYFSSDRTVREYARDIWHLDPVPPAHLL